jgi:hypothetical protein
MVAMIENGFARDFLKNLFLQANAIGLETMHGSISMCEEDRRLMYIMMYDLRSKLGTVMPEFQPLPSRHLRPYKQFGGKNLYGLCAITCSPNNIIIADDPHIPQKEEYLRTTQTRKLIGDTIEGFASSILYTTVNLTVDGVARII